MGIKVIQEALPPVGHLAFWNEFQKETTGITSRIPFAAVLH